MTITNHQVMKFCNLVNCVSWAPWEIGLILAASGADGCISILSRNSNTKGWNSVQKITAHSQGINSIAWAPYTDYQDLVNKQFSHSE